MLGEYRDLAPLLPAGAVATTRDLLHAAGAMDRVEAWLYRQRGFRAFASLMEQRVLPGQALAGALRKRFFDDEVRAAIAAGARQVVNVGAGFDTLCVRLAAAHRGVVFAEIDSPATIARKRQGVETLGLARPNLHLLDADLARAPIASLLSDVAGWRRGANAVVIAEGVLMYLEEPAVARFLDHARATIGEGGRLLFSFMDADDDGRVCVGRYSRLMRSVFRGIGEPLRWGVRRGQLASLLAAHDLRVDGPHARYDLRARYLAPAGLAARPLSEIEHLVCAVPRAQGVRSR